jgi:hypothetical protein
MTNLDRTTEDAASFGTNPFVLPSMKRGNSIMLLTNNFYIDLPIVAAGSNRPNGEGLFADDNGVVSKQYSEQIRASAELPESVQPEYCYQLFTAKAENVQIKIYDMLGKEVQTLVNEVKTPVHTMLCSMLRTFQAVCISTD